MTCDETQIAGLFAKCGPAMAKLGKALRAKRRARLPGLFEIVYMYENQNALIGTLRDALRAGEATATSLP